MATAQGYPLAAKFLDGLHALVSDTSSTFGPSMFRDMSTGRPIEITVLRDLADRAHRERIATPLLDAALVRIDVHNRRLPT